jgi:hypothetical protein
MKAKSTPEVLNLAPKPKVKPYEWALAARVDLGKVYASARTLKNETYRQWILNLSRHLLSKNLALRDEAIRRIEYIETNLIRPELVSAEIIAGDFPIHLGIDLAAPQPVPAQS